MRFTWCKRPLLTLGGVGLVYCLTLLLRSGYEQPVMAGTHLHTSRMVGNLMELEANVSDICELRKKKKKKVLLRLHKTSKQKLS